MEEVTKLLNKRRSVYKRVEKLLEVAQSAQTDPQKLLEFKVRVDSLNELVNLFDSLHLEIVSLLDEEQLDEQDNIQASFDDLQYSSKAIYRECCDERSPASAAGSIKSEVSGSAAVSQLSGSGRGDAGGEVVQAATGSLSGARENVRLPRIEIPKFDGNLKNWPKFIDMFKTLIHENQFLSDIEKFQYLTSYLSGEAVTVLKNLPISGVNYKIAFDALNARYENERLLMTQYWQAVSQAASGSESSSASSLRNLLSTFSENLTALEQFQANVDLWDFTKFNWLLQKIDPVLRTNFEVEHNSTKVPTFEVLQSFLEKQHRALETSRMISGGSVSHSQGKKFEGRRGESKGSGSGSSNVKVAASFVTNTGKVSSCVCCKQQHLVVFCDEFQKLSPQERNELIKRERGCFNCLSGSHMLTKCFSKYHCRICKGRHHTLLHFPKRQESASSSDNVSSNSEVVDASAVSTLASTVSNSSTILFSTVVVEVKDGEGNFQRCRALLDSASQASFVTVKCAKRLCLPFSSTLIPIQGLNEMSSKTTCGTVSSVIRPCNKIEPKFPVNMIVIPKICGNMPSSPVSCQDWSTLLKLPLADSNFGVPSEVEMLLGADIYADIVLPGIKRGCRYEPTAINTVFGWVLIGKVNSLPMEAIHSFLTELDSLDTTLKSFWELEQIPQCSSPAPEDVLCENHFLNTHSREANGRYVVELPFRETSLKLGDSYNAALRRFYSLENRLEKNPSLYEAYSLFLQDYLEQGHMSLVSNPEQHTKGKYYIPHHCVVKPERVSTKVRVVFDASSKSSTGVSLNDLLLVGPKLQKDIISILLVFRVHKLVFTADIRQMYRQIKVYDYHRDYQRILWRFSKNSPVQEFCLNTVTYGVSSSPYLAIRCLLQLANDYKENYPLAAEIITSLLYVDDVVGGAESLESAIKIKSQLISIFGEGCFDLRKWSSNDPLFLSSVPEGHQQPISFDSSQPSGIKVLGLQWYPTTDCFSYTVDPVDRPCNKRNVLSDLAKIYDPLGLLSPITLLAKSFMQWLWTQGVGWDEQPSEEFKGRWSRYKSELACLRSLSIPRRLVVDNVEVTELHSFCDASEVGYAGVVYFRHISHDGSVRVFLVCAKSRVAPLKKISIPRLELCAAVLLSDLVEFVLSVYQTYVHVDRVYAWSDSTVTLTWTQSSPHQWKTFVANRVSHIQDKVSPQCWHHVKGVENPADCASRGLMPSELLTHSLWWAGPLWLSEPSDTWPCANRDDSPSSELQCERRNETYVSVVELHWIMGLLYRFSSLCKITRIVAYCLRFIYNLKQTRENQRRNMLSSGELQQALETIVKVVQHEVFDQEIHRIQRNQLSSKPIRRLTPFLDEQGVLRVGGRLRNSELDYSAKHPMLLPRSHRLTELIIEQVHFQNCHPGLRTLQYLMLQQFWILSSRRAIKHVLSRCYRCFRVKPIPSVPMMSDLPSVRVSQVKCFSHSGVDFAGPILVTPFRRRGVRPVKAYICVFVCFAVKAIHIELVSDLSSEAFLAALRRFIARRGRCTDLYSDCGTNFVGANKLLLSYSETAAHACGITWHFNPPSAPHFGGLWEAGVKSVKTHLKRVIGTQILTFEEMTTVLVQIEALLNSRPLCGVSDDPNDLNVLTPGHFLTLEPLTAPPDEDVSSVKLNRLSRWQLLRRLHQDFWHRWHLEYLHTLQQKSKWHKSQNLPQVDDLVLIKDELHPPLYWQLGRIVKLHPGRDGVPRVATLRTSQGSLQRSLTKLCPLPSSSS